MIAFLKDPVTRGWAVMGVLALLVITLAAPIVWNADDRHLTAYRDGDEDTSILRSRLEGSASSVDAYISTPHQLADIQDPGNALLLVIGAERRYTESEAQAVIQFLERGGNVILADEGGYGTDIAVAAGFGIVNTHLLDSRNHRGDYRLVVATAHVAERSYSVLFNAPTAIRPLRDANPYEVLARSSKAAYPEGSYLDTNNNGEIDLSDGASPDDAGFPLIVKTTVGQGTLILVADTGLFMNAQTRLVDFQNEPFLADLVGSLIPRDGALVIDEGRHAPTPALALYDNSVRALGLVTSGSIAPFVSVALVVLATIGAWFATRETEDWSHHHHNLGVELSVPPDVRPDLDRAQRMARRRISERFNIPLEQVAAMPAEQLFSLSGDKMLAEAAAGTLKSDPATLFRQFSEAPR